MFSKTNTLGLKKILTWIKPTWAGMHLGNYLWMFKQLIENSKWKESYLMIADYHSLTSKLYNHIKKDFYVRCLHFYLKIVI